jgi:hypothetical protein
MGTHTLQRPLAEVKSEALDFMVFMYRIVFGANCDRHFVINMDQAPVYYSMNAKRTLELIERKNNPHPHFDGRHKAGDCGSDDLC